MLLIFKERVEFKTDERTSRKAIEKIGGQLKDLETAYFDVRWLPAQYSML